MRFHIGDRVEALAKFINIRSGETGTVCHIVGDRVGVEWDTEISGGHSCRGHCEDGHGWFAREEEIELHNKVDEIEEEIDEHSFLSIAF